MSVQPALSARHLTRRFGSVVAVDDVTLDVHPGVTTGLLGPNGSGKTTLLSLAAGLIAPSGGDVRLFGLDPQQPAARVGLGVTPQSSGLDESLRVSRLVDLVAANFPLAEGQSELLSSFGLDGLAARRIGTLSGGQKRLLAVALAFVGCPRLVLLDEPSTGLDVEARENLWQAIRVRAELGTTIILTSHYLEEVQALASRIVILRRGQVISDGLLDDILESSASTRVRLTTSDDAALNLAGVVTGHREGEVVVLVVDDVPMVIGALADSGIAYRDLEVQRPTLDSAFVELTKERSS